MWLTIGGGVLATLSALPGTAAASDDLAQHRDQPGPCLGTITLPGTYAPLLDEWRSKHRHTADVNTPEHHAQTTNDDEKPVDAHGPEAADETERVDSTGSTEEPGWAAATRHAHRGASPTNTHARIAYIARPDGDGDTPPLRMIISLPPQACTGIPGRRPFEEALDRAGIHDIGRPERELLANATAQHARPGVQWTQWITEHRPGIAKRLPGNSRWLTRWQTPSGPATPTRPAIDNPFSWSPALDKWLIHSPADAPWAPRPDNGNPKDAPGSASDSWRKPGDTPRIADGTPRKTTYGQGDRPASPADSSEGPKDQSGKSRANSGKSGEKPGKSERHSEASGEKPGKSGGRSEASGEKPAKKDSAPRKTKGDLAVEAAIDRLGTPFSWGGGSASGPTKGIGRGVGTVGFDCSGLTLYAWAKAGVKLGHYTGTQFDHGRRISVKDLRKGDLVFFGGGTGDPTHVGIYLGGGVMIHAPKTGDVVKKTQFLDSTYYRPIYRGAVRPG